jgi:hypothetical protein
MRAALVSRLTVRHRPDHRELIGELGGLGKRLTELLTFDLGRDRTHVTAIFDGSKRLGIERFLVRDPAGQEDMDHRVGLGCDRRVTFEIRPGLEPDHVSQSQSPQSDRSNRKKTSTIHLVLDAAISHRRNSFFLPFSNSLTRNRAFSITGQRPP